MGKIGRKQPCSKDDLFSDYIYENNVVCCPCTFFIRTGAFRKIIPSMHIYENMSGQNWQIILPAVYSLNYGYLDGNLYKYLYREDSESHKNDGYEYWIKRRRGFIEILNHTIDSIDLMPIEDKKKWKQIAVLRQIKMMMILSAEYHKYTEYLHYKNEIIINGGQISFKENYFIHQCLRIPRYIKKSVFHKIRKEG